MTKEQADAIVDVLQSLVYNSEEYWLKISAAEQVLRNHSPELWSAYQTAVDSRQNSAKVRGDHGESERVLAMLRKTLSTD